MKQFTREFAGLMILMAANGAAAWTVSDGIIDLPPALENDLRDYERPREPRPVLSLRENDSENEKEDEKQKQEIEKKPTEHAISQKNQNEDKFQKEEIHKPQAAKENERKEIESAALPSDPNLRIHSKMLREAELMKVSIQKKEASRKEQSKKPAVFQKRLAKLQENEQAVEEYSHALEYINMGEVSKAIPLLEQGLKKAPNQIMIRVQLASLYLKQNRDLDAEYVLQNGLQLSNDNPEFLKLLAVLYERRGEADKALEAINKIPVNRRNDKESTAFLGHLLQSTGHHAKARELYERLQRAEPQNPLWMLGIAVSFDAEGRKKEALQSYEKLRKESMDTKMSKYADRRIAILNR